MDKMRTWGLGKISKVMYVHINENKCTLSSLINTFEKHVFTQTQEMNQTCASD